MNQNKDEWKEKCRIEATEYCKSVYHQINIGNDDLWGSCRMGYLAAKKADREEVERLNESFTKVCLMQAESNGKTIALKKEIGELKKLVTEAIPWVSLHEFFDEDDNAEGMEWLEKAKKWSEK